MASKTIAVSLTEELLEMIDSLTKRQLSNRSALIEQLLREWLNKLNDSKQ